MGETKQAAMAPTAYMLETKQAAMAPTAYMLETKQAAMALTAYMGDISDINDGSRHYQTTL